MAYHRASKSSTKSSSPTYQEPTKPARADGDNTWQTKSRQWMPRPDDAKAHPRRTLVLCFDGTGDQFDEDNSNVVQFMAALKKDDPRKQMVYYQSGLGTRPGVRRFTKASGSMIASNLARKVRDGYNFLMQNYIEGDSICLFGFSRGAYTALALAGMLQKVGLLPPHNSQQLPFAWKMYKHEDETSLRLSRDFKRTFSIDVNIEFVGVWDTVSSVGIFPRYLPFVSSNSSIHYFRHALALDERRAKFSPNFHKQWEDDDNEHEDNGNDDKNDKDDHSFFGGPAAESPTEVRSPGTGGLEKAHASTAVQEESEDEKKKHHSREHTEQWLYEQQINNNCKRRTDVLEVWFAGCHADVGGGSVKNGTRFALSRIPLRWMVRECFRCHTGIIFDMDMLKGEMGLDIDTRRRIVLDPPERVEPSEVDRLVSSEAIKKRLSRKSKKALALPAVLARRGEQKTSKGKRKGIEADIEQQNREADEKGEREPFRGEAYEDLYDSLSPAYDQLSLALSWWALEIVPLRLKKQKAIYGASDRISDYMWRANRGQGRHVYRHVVERGLKVHRSVLTRLEALDALGQEASYIPRIRPHIVKEPDYAHRRRLTQDEWRTGQVEGPSESWLEWV